MQKGETEKGSIDLLHIQNLVIGHLINILYKKQLLSQENLCIKWNFGDMLLSIEELKDVLQSNCSNKMQYYVKQISGTNSYWYQVKEQLKAALYHEGLPTSFWNLIYAECHWPQFHEMFKLPILETECCENVLDYLHTIDRFFCERTEKFIKRWLYVLGVDWYWNRYEYAVLRNDIHIYRLGKLKMTLVSVNYLIKLLKVIKLNQSFNQT